MGRFNPRLDVGAEECREWALSIAYALDEPAPLVVPEINMVTKEWSDSSVTACLLSPVPYSAIIANLGVQALYEDVNRRNEGLILERCYFPERKMLRRMEKASMPLFSKESYHPLYDFDVLGFSVFYPVQYLNFPIMLDLAGQKRLAKDRANDDPIILMGGICSFNPEPVADACDAVFIGEGDIVFSKALHMVGDEKAKGFERDKLLYRWATELPGFYVPSFYKVEYFRGYGVRKHEAEREGVADVVVKAVANMSQIDPPVMPLVPVTPGGEMSTGAIEISRGCSNFCTFCEGTFRSIPYRERSLAAVQKGFDALIKNTGVKTCTPYAFNLSDFGPINKLVLWLLQDQDRKISMSSQRVDMFSYDFASVAYMSGNHSITLAIEAGSQNMRDRVSKNLTMEQILRTCRTAFKIGFSKIKFYMIANLPMETQDDIDGTYDSTLELMEEIAKIRDKYSPKTKCIFSFTPFQSKNTTPMQWADSRNLLGSGSMSNLVEACHRLRFRFRIGTSSDLSVVAQMLTMGDRRMWRVIERAVDEGVLQYFGGMTVGKDVKEVFEKVIEETIEGHNFDTYYDEKPYDTVFPWDFIDIGMRKEYLLRQWENYKEARTTPSCFQGCRACGGCDLTPGYNVATYKLKRQEKDTTLAAAGSQVVKAKKPNIQKWKARVEIEEGYRYVERGKVKLALRRAMWRAGLPVRDAMLLVTDRIRFQNWSYGIDYANGWLYEKIVNPKSFIEKINAELTGMKITDLTTMSAGHEVGAKAMYDFVAYEVQTDYNNEEAESAVKKLLEPSSIIVPIKMPGNDKGIWVTTKTEVREMIGDVWYEMNDKGAVVRLTLRDRIGPYEVLPYAFGSSRRNMLRYPVRRLEYLREVSSTSFDMFVDHCSVCDQQIERSMFDQQIAPSLCLRHMPFDSPIARVSAVDDVADEGMIDIDDSLAEEFAMSDVDFTSGDGMDESQRKFLNDWDIQ